MTHPISVEKSGFLEKQSGFKKGRKKKAQKNFPVILNAAPPPPPLKFDSYERERLPIIFAAQHQVFGK